MDVKQERILSGMEKGDLQFFLPLFQRSYAWEKTHWETLFEDIVSLSKEDGGDANHFTGSIVTSPKNLDAGDTPDLLLIDGQQRLTTTSLFLIALRNKFRKVNKKEWQTKAEEIQERYLINKYQEGDKKLKLLPQKADRETYRNLVLEEGVADKNHLMSKAVSFFNKALTPPKNSSLSLEEWLNKIFEKGIQRFKVVWISLSKEDDAYAVFESLNGKGLPLTQTDLLRNHSMMLFGTLESQEKESAECWSVIDSIFPTPKDKKIEEEFFRRWMLSLGFKITKKAIYEKGKKIFDDLHKKNELIHALKKISLIAPYYKAFAQKENKSKEIDTDILHSFQRMHEIGCSSASAFILHLTEKFLEDSSFKHEFLETLKIIESYFLRRRICGLVANAEEIVFANLVKAFLEQDKNIPRVAEFTSESLFDVKGNGRFPREKEFKEKFLENSLTDLKKKNGSLTAFTLFQIEKHLNKSSDSLFKDYCAITIFPEKPSASWKNSLSQQDIVDCEEHALTFGNIALISQKDFPKKGIFTHWGDLKRTLEKASLSSNQDILKADTWRYQNIKERSEKLFKTASECWPVPLAPSEENEDIFFCDAEGVNASGAPCYEGKGWIIFKGSKGRAEVTSNPYYHSDNEARKELIANNSLKIENNHIVFLENVTFTSISAASKCLFGTSRQGPEDWMDINGKTYGTRKRDGEL